MKYLQDPGIARFLKENCHKNLVYCIPEKSYYSTGLNHDMIILIPPIEYPGRNELSLIWKKIQEENILSETNVSLASV